MANLQIKQKLAEGKPVMVISGLHGTDMVDYLGQFGPDGVWLEGEHGPITWEQIGDLSRAADLWNMASITRIMGNEPWLITRTLDRGASGICVPHVSTKAEAEQVARSAKFAPLGDRGMFSGRRSYGVGDYFKQANEETFVIILIEEMEAINNLAEILTVDNIDVFFIAPADLAQTMGYVGQPTHPEVLKVIDSAVQQIVAAGKTAGVIGTDQNIDHYFQLGVRFFLTSWLPWVAKGARDSRARFDALKA